MKMATYTTIPPLTDEEAIQALNCCKENINTWLHCFTYQFKNSHSTNGFYNPVGNFEWTTGFWTGQIWLAYELEHDERLKKAAEIQVGDFYTRIKTKHDVNHHDMGFLYSLACVAAWRLTGNKMAREAALEAAENLAGRFQKLGGFIQAWGELGDPAQYRLIIDCLLNVPLLFWAAEESGNEEYRTIANTHIDTALKNVVRPDFSTYHTFYFDTETGEPDHGCTHQGYSDDSVWARGQAWGVYGIALAYTLTKKPKYLEIWRKVTDCFLDKLPEDGVPFWDMIFTAGSDEPRDSSAGAIVVCGILEMLRHDELPDKKLYEDISRRLMGSLVRDYGVKNPMDSNGLLLHSTYCKSSAYNTCPNMGVDECNAWGDYFYMEALTRIVNPNWRAYW